MLRWACFLLAVFLLNFSAPTFAADANDGFDKAIKLRVEQYEDALKINQLLWGFDGAAYALQSLTLYGEGDINYWEREASIKKVGLEALGNWISSSLPQVNDPTLKIALKSIVNSINGLDKGFGDTKYWCDRASRLGNLAQNHYNTLEDLKKISDQNLEKVNLSTQARAIAESDPEAFSKIMTDGMKTLLAQLDSEIAAKTSLSKQADATAQKLAQKLAEISAKVEAMTAKLVSAERQSASLNTSLQSVQAQVRALVASGKRGQDRVQMHGLVLVSDPESLELKSQFTAQAARVLSYLREKLSARANPKFPFNPNLTLTYTIKKSLNKNYGLLRFRGGVRKVIAEGTLNLEMSDGVNTSNVSHDFNLSFFPKGNELRLDLRRFVEKEAVPELKVLQKLSAGTAKYEDVLNAIEAKLSGQCDKILGALAAPSSAPNASNVSDIAIIQ